MEIQTAQDIDSCVRFQLLLISKLLNSTSSTGIPGYLRHTIRQTFENLNGAKTEATMFTYSKTKSSLQRPELLLLLSAACQYRAQQQVIPFLSKDELMFTIDLISNDIQKQLIIKKYISTSGKQNKIAQTEVDFNIRCLFESAEMLL